MKFDNLHIEGFLSIGQANIHLMDRGLVLIEGKNLDDTSAKSNGAGKSSLVDALCWCLYGKTARGLSGDEVINKKGKSCCVAITLQEKTDTWCITRTRKGKSIDLTITHEYLDQSNPEEPGTIGPVEEDLTKGTVAETQATVEQIIGCPYNVFVAAVYAGQEAMPDLPSMTDKQLKELIESVIGVERLTKAYDLAKEQWGEAKNKAEAEKLRLDMKEAELKTKQDSLETAKNNDKDFFAQIESQKAALQKKIDDAKVVLAAAEKEDAGYEKQQKEIEDKVASLTNAINNIAVFKKKADEAGEAVSQARMEAANASARFNNLKDEAVRLSEEAKHVSDRVGTKCSECGKVYTEEDIAEAKANAIAKAKKFVIEAQAAKKAWEDTAEKAEKTTAEWEKAKQAIPDTSVLAKKSALMDQLSQIKANRSKPDWVKKEIDSYESSLKALDKTKASYSSLANQIEWEMAQTISDVANLRASYNKAEEKVAVLDACKEIYGPTGVRQHVLDTITPILNDRTARYLDVLSDGKLQAVWTTLTRTKKGEVKEKFNIAVTNRVGGGSFESLSGGEKRKVRVACCLALQELVASRATKPIELFIADEVDHALDEAGVERLIGVLQEKADCCKSLFVISHNPLRNWIENVITVTKHDGISTVE